MTSFSRILSLPYASYYFTWNGINASCPRLGPNIVSNVWKIFLTHSRLAYTTKSVKNIELEPEKRKQHSLFQLNTLSRFKNESKVEVNEPSEPQSYSDFSDVIRRIQNEPLDQRSIRNHLFGLLIIFKQQRFLPDYATKIESFKKSNEFEKLTQSLEQMLPMMTPKYLHIIFQVMHSYQIPYSSILMQKLHALILDNINNFELANVIQMYLIINQNDDKLLEPLKSAFLTYMKHLTMDSLNFSADLKGLIYYASKKEVPLSTREKIVKKILSMGPSLKDLDPTLLSSLSFLLSSEEFKTIDKRYYIMALQKILAEGLTFFNLKIFLLNLTEGIRNKVISYDKSLFDCVALGATKCNLITASYVMSKLLRIGHLNYTLATYIADEFIECDKKMLTQSKIEEIINNLGSSDYKKYSMTESHVKWGKLETEIKNSVESMPSFKNIQTALSLCILELDTEELISKALANFAEYMESNSVSDISLQHAILVYQLYCSIYSSSVKNVPENFVSNCMSRIKNTCQFEWSETLNKAFGGEDYVLKKCRSPYGTIISYIIVIGPDRKPINLSSYKIPESEATDSLDNCIEIEKIERPPGSKVFGLIEWSKEPVKYRKCGVLRPIPRVMSHLHKNLGYKIFHLYFRQKTLTNEGQSNFLTSLVDNELNKATSDKIMS